MDQQRRKRTVMSKKRKISRAEEYAIKYLYETIKMDAATISNELDISVSTIDKILAVAKNPATIPTATSSASSDVSKNIVISQTLNKNGGVSIMTQHGSAAGDSACRSSQETVSRTAKNAIYRPRG